MQSMQKILGNVTPQQICSARPVMQKKQPQEAMSSSSNNTCKADRRIDLLFSKFAAFYGHVWRSQFKDEVFLKFAKKEWKEALSEFSDVVLTSAIVNCRGFYELPPTLPQMLQACRQIKKQSSSQIMKEHYVPPNSQLVESCLQRCKEILGK